MNQPRDLDAIIATWLEGGPIDLPDETRRAISVGLRTPPRVRRTAILGGSSMNPIWRVAAAAAMIIALGALAAFALSNRAGGSAAVPSSPRASMIPSTSPSAPPSASAASTSPSSPTDTSAWMTYHSDRYGFDTGYPTDWTVEPADHDWTIDADSKDFLSRGQEAFIAPGRTIRVSAWSVPIGPTPDMQDPALIEAWIKDYCQKSSNSPCTGIHERAVPLCVETRDCHPGLLVPFADDVQAFATGGIYDRKLVVVAVWWGETAPAVAPYGGSRRLLEAYLSTMNIWPAP